MTSDVQVAQTIAQAVGLKVMVLQREAGPVDYQNRSEILALKDRGDQAAQLVVEEILADLRPDDALLSEEKPDSEERLTHDRVWIIDPIDGTSNFGYRGKEFAVHVALWERGRGLTAAALGVPAQDRILSTDLALDFPNPRAITVRRDRTNADPVRFITSRTHPPAITNDLDYLREFFAGRGVTTAGAQVGKRSSVGIKVLALIDDQADVYIHDAGFNEWDAAAPVAIAMAHGLVASRADGSPFEFNKRNPIVEDLVVCRPELHPLVIELLAH